MNAHENTFRGRMPREPDFEMRIAAGRNSRTGHPHEPVYEPFPDCYIPA
jgi:hypothetical protein